MSSDRKYSPTSAWWKHTISVGLARRQSCVEREVAPKPCGEKNLQISLKFILKKLSRENLGRNCLRPSSVAAFVKVYWSSSKAVEHAIAFGARALVLLFILIVLSKASEPFM